MQTTRRTISNGTIQVVKQCSWCGKAVGGPLPHSSVHVVDALPEFDVALLKRAEERQREYWDGIRAHSEAAREAWRAEYDAYLLTPEWRAKRQKALERDKHTCQGCLSARATVVHHHTYTHMGHELMFQLISLCEDCHDWFHHGGRGGA